MPANAEPHRPVARPLPGADHKDGAAFGVRVGEEALRDQFARLVRQHTPGVVAVIRRRAARGVDAEDVAQDVFCKAWQAMQRGESVQDFRAWVLTIAYRSAVSASRRVAVRRAFLMGRLGEAPTPAPSAETPAMWDLARRVLGAEQATALWLTVGEGLTARQTGLVLGKDEGAVRMMVSRARKRLAEEAVRCKIL